ncbi:hypothetical protein VN97_g4576 [Penicillium thymicola]|uniref:Uncharacterized protein n=1 Tax=Penicillium thymicola TaxID=293382 RepID=A0AAI9TK93_PENTH|nr:hypothetical protein VN97_g4576 [Penicillium thymicola]
MCGRCSLLYRITETPKHPFEVLSIQQLLTMALPPAEKKEPMEAQIKSVDMTEDMQQEAIALGMKYRARGG